MNCSVLESILKICFLINFITCCKGVVNVNSLNTILQCDGWKEIEKVTVDYTHCGTGQIYEVKVEDLIKPSGRSNSIVTRNNFNEKSSNSLTVIAAVYCQVLNPLIEVFSNTRSYYDNNNNHQIVRSILSCIQSAQYYYPLITCMIQVLEFFNHPNQLLATLKNLKNWCDEFSSSVNSESFEGFDSCSLVKLFEKAVLLNIFNGDFRGCQYDYNNPDENHPYIDDFLQSITESCFDGTRYINPYQPNLSELFSQGVYLYCHNFGFTDQVLGTNDS